MAIRNISEWVDSLRPRVPTVTAEQLAERLEEDDDLVLVDVREIQERVDLGAIPGSRHVPRGMLEFWADPSSKYHRDYFGEDKEYVLYCAGGQRSVLASVALMDLGFERVSHLEGGFRAWAEEDLPVDDVASRSKWVRRSS